MPATYEEGQKVKHAQYGLGTVLASDEERTQIDFVQHGTKKFVTSMVVLEFTDEDVPKRKGKARRPRKAKK
jgi:predicted secreted protein